MEPRSSLTLLNTLGAWASAASVLIAQATVWMSTGVWPNWRFSDAFSLVGVSEPPVHPDAVHGVVHWVLSWPLVVGVFVCMAIVSAVIAPRGRP